MYTLFDYGEMIGGNSRVRLDTFKQAIFSQVKPGDVVLEIGAGPGIFSLLACEAGASKVYAVDPDPSVEHAAELARQNGFNDKVEIFCGTLKSFSLEEKVDVIVSDLRGSLPLFWGSVATLLDAKERFLKPEGVMIPLRDSVFAAPVCAPSFYEKYTAPWRNLSDSIDASGLEQIVLNTALKSPFKESQCLCKASKLFEINYPSVAATDFAGSALFATSQLTDCHGVAVWFDSEIAAGTGYSNAPGQPELVYEQTFFPFLKPLTLMPQSSLSFELKADYISNDYVWRWNTEFFQDRDDRNPTERFEQSNFFAESLSYELVKSNNRDAVPVRSDSGEVELFILSSFNGTLSLKSIAQQAFEKFPDTFASYREAIDRVALSARRFGEF